MAVLPCALISCAREVRRPSECLCGNLLITLLRPWIVASHHFTTAVTEGDGSVRVLGHQGAIQLTSNTKPTLRNGAGCLRNSHVAFGDVGGWGPCQR
jgi:hypothetical protein